MELQGIESLTPKYEISENIKLLALQGILKIKLLVLQGILKIKYWHYKLHFQANQNHMQGIESEHEYKSGSVGWVGGS